MPRMISKQRCWHFTTWLMIWVDDSNFASVLCIRLGKSSLSYITQSTPTHFRHCFLHHLTSRLIITALVFRLLNIKICQLSDETLLCRYLEYRTRDDGKINEYSNINNEKKQDCSFTLFHCGRKITYSSMAKGWRIFVVVSTINN